MFNVTVFLSSGQNVDRKFFDLAREAGDAIARQGWTLVYGGNAVGPMKSLADGAREAGGKVVGITPQVFVDHGVADTRCDELIVVKNMGERKHLLAQRADAFLTLPGGVGTLEEFIEILVAKQLAYHKKPIALLDMGGVWAPMMEFFERGIANRFVRETTRTDFARVDDVSAAIRYFNDSFTK